MGKEIDFASYTGLQWCDICDTWTPYVTVDDNGYPEDVCQYCWDAYGWDALL